MAYLIVSHPPPACLLETALQAILLISHSVHINAADVHVDLLLSELAKQLKDVSLPKTPPDITCLTGSMASQVQE